MDTRHAAGKTQLVTLTFAPTRWCGSHLAPRSITKWCFSRKAGAGRLLPQELLDHGRLPYRRAMFKIVLQPEEDAVLCAIRDGLCPAAVVPGPVLLKLIALGMVRCDAHGNPSLTDLAEAALARMRGKIH